MAYGIDTIKIGYKVDPELIDFDKWTRVEQSSVNKSEDILFRDYYFKEYKTPKDSVISLRYIHKDYRGKLFHMLFIEFSIPKLINGQNHGDIDDWDQALNLANKTIASIVGLPKLPDIRQAFLYRIDIYANFQVGNNVSEYISALGKAHRSRRRATHYSDTGVLFKSNEISVTIYDKERESRHKEAHGILRLEISIRKKRKIETYFDKRNPRLGDINFELLRERIQKELRELSLDKPILSDRSQVETKLSQVYNSKCRVLKLLGYWDVRQTMTREQLIKEGYTKRFVRYCEKLLSEADISINGNVGGKELPALLVYLR